MQSTTPNEKLAWHLNTLLCPDLFVNF